MNCNPSEKEKLIERAIGDGWMVCCYGLGHMGKTVCSEIPKIFNLTVSLFCDRDDERVRRFVLEGARPIYLNDLLSAAEDILVFVLVDDPYDVEIVENLSINPHLHLITLRDMLDMDEVIRYYFGEELYGIYSKTETEKGI